MDVLSQASSYCLGGRRALLLPSKEVPRVLVPDVAVRQRWVLSAIYPAFRLRAFPWRLWQRVRAVVFAGEKVSLSQRCAITSYLQDVIPEVSHTGVLLGINNSYRKILVQIWADDQLKAYLKCSTNRDSARMVMHEASILHDLPSGAGPKLLKQGQIDGNDVMLQSVVPGEMLKADVHALLTMLPALQEFQLFLQHGESFGIDEHPAMVRLGRHVQDAVKTKPDQRSIINERLGSLLAPLRKRRWPSVIQHGDFTPWNILRTSQASDINLQTSGLCAIDWEEGVWEGFPYFDLVYCFLQTARLIHQWPADKAFRFAAVVLERCGLDPEQAESVVRLSALDAFFRFSSRSGDKSTDLQQFRLAIISHESES